MARRLILALASLVAGCFHAGSYAPDHATQMWRQARPQPQPQSAASGGEAPQPRRFLNADQAYQLSLANSADLAVALARAEVAEAEVSRAKQLDNPQLRVTNFRVDDVIADQTRLDVGLRVPIPRPGARRAKTAAAKYAAQGERSWTEDAQRRLRRVVDRRFAELAALEADLEYVTEASHLAALRRDEVKARFEATLASNLDLALADVATTELSTEASRLQGEIDAIEGGLRRLAGVRGPTGFRPDAGLLRVTDSQHEREELIEQALEARPELRVTRARVGEARAQAHIARSSAWPWFDWAQAEYLAGPGSSASTWGFGVAITLPALSLNRGEIKATKASVRQREAEEWAQVAVVANEVGEAIDAVERTAKRAHKIETELMPQTDRAAREARAAQDAGALDPLATGKLESRALSVRRMLVAALLEHRRAVIELETAVGATQPRPTTATGAKDGA